MKERRFAHARFLREGGSAERVGAGTAQKPQRGFQNGRSGPVPGFRALSPYGHESEDTIN